MTHHPDHRNLSESIKIVYASIWKFRAFEEREFFRIVHLETAMGVLLQRNVLDEEIRGVAASKDLYFGPSSMDHYFYIDAQFGVSLVKNPGAGALPEQSVVVSKRPPPEEVALLRQASKRGRNRAHPPPDVSRSLLGISRSA